MITLDPGLTSLMINPQSYSMLFTKRRGQIYVLKLITRVIYVLIIKKLEKKILGLRG